MAVWVPGGVEVRGEDSAIRNLADRRSPQLRRYQLLGGGKNQLGSGTALPCCVSLVNLLNFSGLTFPHIHSLVTGSLRGLHEGDCHSSWFRAWDLLVLFSREILLCASVSPSLQGGHVVWWWGTRTLVSESPEGYPASDAGCMTLSKSSSLCLSFLNYKTEMLTIPPASKEHGWNPTSIKDPA